MKLHGRKSPRDSKSSDSQMKEVINWSSNRYLQIHFEELHLGNSELRQELALQRQILEDLRRIVLLLAKTMDSEPDDESAGTSRLFHFSGKNN